MKKIFIRWLINYHLFLREFFIKQTTVCDKNFKYWLKKYEN